MYFLNINKPKDITSFDVIKVLRKKLSIKAIGHSGTLDPFATGVLQIAVGKATKLLDYLDSDKEYVAKIKFGYISDTFDEEGEIQFVKKPDFSLQQLKDQITAFIGDSMQTPPIYSAIKVNGKKMCDLARSNPNNTPTPKPRPITIYSIDLIDFNGVDEATIKIFCKKGTYIRSLANDLGQKLGCGAYVKELTRTKAGNFFIENSQSLQSDTFNEINPLEVINLPKFELKDEEYNRIKNGNYITAQNCSIQNTDVILTKNNKLVSIGNLSDNLIRPKKNF